MSETPRLIEMTPADYHADKVCEVPTLSRSIAHTLVDRSPAHAYAEHPKLGGQPDDPSKKMDLGTVGHRIVLGRGSDYAVVEAKDWRTNVARDAAEAARKDGKIPILNGQLDEAREMSQAFHAQFGQYGALYDAFAAAQSEQVGVWSEGETVCRCMFDRLCIDEPNKRAIIFDLKTTENAHPRSCSAKVIPLGYDMQDEFYTRGLRAIRPDLQGRIRFVFLFLETSFPFALTPLELCGEHKSIGVSRVMRAIPLWAECLKAHRWPAYASDVLRSEAKPWELTQEFGADSLAETMARK